MHSMYRDRVVRCTEFILFPTHHMHCNCVFTYVTLHDASTGTQRRDISTAFPLHMAHHDSISTSLSTTVLYLSCHQHTHAFTSTFHALHPYISRTKFYATFIILLFLIFPTLPHSLPSHTPLSFNSIHYHTHFRLTLYYSIENLSFYNFYFLTSDFPFLFPIFILPLGGLDLATRLIKGVSCEIRHSHPDIELGTLSPVPGFKSWLLSIKNVSPRFFPFSFSSYSEY